MRKLIVGIALFFLIGMGSILTAQEDSQLRALQEAIKANPKDSVAHFNLGGYYAKTGRYDQAIPEYEKCLQINSDDQQAKLWLEICQGLVESSKRNFPGAIQHFQNVLKIDPSNVDANRLLNQCSAQLFMDQGKYAEAVTALSQLVKADPKNIDAYQSLGVAYYNMKNYKQAAACWEKTTKVQKDAQIYKILGYSYYNLGDFNNAISNYKKSIEIESAKDPKQQNVESLGDTYYNLAVAYNDNALYDDAVLMFKKAFETNPKDSNAAVGQARAIDSATNAHMEKASNFLLSNHYSQAISEWNKVLTYQSDNKQAQDFIADAKAKLDTEVEKHFAAGTAASKKGNTLRALSEFNLALEMDPENEKVKAAKNHIKVKTSERVKSLVTEAEQLYAAQDYAGALEKYQQAKSLSPGSATIKARIKKLTTKQNSEIKDAFTKAKKLFANGDLKSALKYLLEAKQINSNDPEINKTLFQVQKTITVKVKDWDAEGVSLFESGNKEGAKAKFTQVLKLKPNDETANEYIKKMTGQQSQAKVNAEKAKELYYEGVNLYINGKIHEAIAKWKECKVQDPGNVNAQKNIDKAMAKLKSIENLSTN
jgi:tetratricopeptide (TPR) repeat protein